MQGQTKGLYFIHALPCSLQKHNLEQSTLVVHLLWLAQKSYST